MIGILSLNHHAASVELRERYALSQLELSGEQGLLRNWVQRNGIDEVAILSTCNRVEILWHGDADAQTIAQAWSEAVRGQAPEIIEHATHFVDSEAMLHFMEVCAGLDSMVLGEPQILGQAKDAFAKAQEAKTLGPKLHRFIEKALHAAKRARTESGIGDHAVGISYYAVRLAEQIFDGIEEQRILVLGAGEMAELAVRHFAERNAHSITIWNRTYKRALDLAGELNVEAAQTEHLEAEVEDADIVLVSTGANDYVLRTEVFKRLLKVRRGRPYLVLDISVPRNVEPSIGDLDNVYLYDIDTLRGITEENARKREQAVDAAKQILQQQAHKWASQSEQQERTQILGQLYGQWNQILMEELDRSQKKHQWGDAVAQQAREMVDASLRKLLHPVQQSVKQRAASGQDNEELFELFGLNQTHEEDSA